MERKSTFKERIEKEVEAKRLPSKIGFSLLKFHESYQKAVGSTSFSLEKVDALFLSFLDMIQEQLSTPYSFEPVHYQTLKPYDYYSFGLNFLHPLIDEKQSTLKGKDQLQEIQKKLEQGENVIFLANHQIEADPQAISLLFGKEFAHLAKEMFFIAGERVITDPLAVPFSLGRNLICIYSKRYIENPPELKATKQLHNKKTMASLSDLLRKGGKAIYVAPSGGRDRRNQEGVIEVSPFDPQSIEMLYLTAKKAETPTSFYPMALSTYTLLPPPSTIQVEIGEERVVARDGIHLSIGKKIDMENYPGCTASNKQEKREKRAAYIWGIVSSEYETIVKK